MQHRFAGDDLEIRGLNANVAFQPNNPGLRVVLQAIGLQLNGLA
jgi:hypothetical protein